ncbi:MAG: peptide-methionine (S)-S-oxide reductase MsrA [Candidatus Saccharimonadales bacterium]
MQAIYLAGGCFWGMEELFRDQPGVIDTEVGYMGGKNDNPTYEHHPGHAEALKVIYDDRIISYDELLDFFFRIHDPTTLNQQGNDIGTSYRSAIFYENEKQKHEAESAILRINASGLYGGDAVTSLESFARFWPAENEHQDYLQKHPGGYTCHYERTHNR